MILPCLHRFNTSCIKEWLHKEETCPNCKDNILSHFNQQQNIDENLWYQHNKMGNEIFKDFNLVEEFNRSGLP